MEAAYDPLSHHLQTLDLQAAEDRVAALDEGWRLVLDKLACDAAWKTRNSAPLVSFGLAAPTDAINGMYGHVRTTLFELARQCLGGGYRIEIDDSAVLRGFGKTERLQVREDFIPSQLWGALVERYGDGKGQAMALHQSAARLRSYFLPRYRDHEPSVGRGHVTFKVRACSESSLRTPGHFHYSSSYTRSALEACAALLVLAQWAQIEGLDDDLRAISQSPPCLYSPFAPRDHFGGAGVRVTCFKSGMHWRIRQHVAEALSVFISTHAPPDEAAA